MRFTYLTVGRTILKVPLYFLAFPPISGSPPHWGRGGGDEGVYLLYLTVGRTMRKLSVLTSLSITRWVTSSVGKWGRITYLTVGRTMRKLSVLTSLSITRWVTTSVGGWGS
jgi:hypothetical protein